MTVRPSGAATIAASSPGPAAWQRHGGCPSPAGGISGSEDRTRTVPRQSRPLQGRLSEAQLLRAMPFQAGLFRWGHSQAQHLQARHYATAQHRHSLPVPCGPSCRSKAQRPSNNVHGASQCQPAGAAWTLAALNVLSDTHAARAASTPMFQVGPTCRVVVGGR